MRQTVFPPGQPMAPWMKSIHFILKDGIVRIVGTVPSVEERQRIEAAVGLTPGVVRIYNALTVNASAGAAAGAVNSSASGNANATVNPVNLAPVNPNVPPNPAGQRP
jgi:hypothetical protein